MATYTVKRRDTAPVIQDVLLDKDGSPVNATGATIRFHMASWDLTTVVVAAGAVTGWNGAALGAAGQFEYAWASGDVVAAGVYKAELEVTYANGKIETFPNEGFAVVNIPADLA